MRSAVDVMGRCNGPCLSVSRQAAVDRGESVCFPCPPAMLIVLSGCRRRVVVCTCPVVLGGVSLLPSPRSDWLALVELNFLARLGHVSTRPTPSRITPAPPLPVPLIVLIVRLTGS